MRRDGFTLAELLLALVILGVIATFTLPKVLNSQADSKKKAIFKEGISLLHEASYNLVLNGTIKLRSHSCGSSSPVNPDVFNDVINYVSLTETSPTQNRYTLANGSQVRVNIGNIIDLHVDYNGPNQGPNTFGQDRVVFFLNDCDGTYAGVLPPGKYGMIPAQPTGFISENAALWGDIFKN